MKSEELQVIDLRRSLELVVQAGLRLARSSDLRSLVQAATDAGLELSGAQFGAFFYNVIDASGESYLLYTLSGVDPEKFSKFPMPRNTAVFAPTFEGAGVVRSADITQDPRYGHNSPYFGKPEGHLPVRSYLAVPVKAISGEVLGGLFYGHEKTNVFAADSEDLVATIAAQAAAAIENFRLRDQLAHKIRDLEKAEQAQNEASKHLAELAAIVESSDDVIVSKDLNGVIRSWNQSAANVFGYSAEEIIGKSILILIPEELRSEEPLIIERIRAGQRIDHYETVRLSKSGERIPVSLTISPVRDKSGAIVGASKILRDVSGRKRVEAALLQAEKIAATGRMAATIAHEVNNPLEAVMNLLYLAQTNTESPETVREYLRAAESEVVRVSHIARQTLGYYRENASAVSTKLTELVADAVRIYDSKCAAAGISIRSSLRSARTVRIRKGEMMQVISNLVANSIYAMPTGGTLTLAVEDANSPAGPAVALIIEDTGTGIPAKEIPRIFEAFYTTRKTIGTGIGLFIAKQFVEGHDGQIAIATSTDPASHGTRMTVTLPTEDAVSNHTLATGSALSSTLLSSPITNK
jgi:PAS domain S-box-containing protein